MGVTPINDNTCHLTGQSLAARNRKSDLLNELSAHEKIGPVKSPCDRPIDLILDRFAHFFGEVTIGRSTATVNGNILSDFV
jgi:hypothetical protein